MMTDETKNHNDEEEYDEEANDTSTDTEAHNPDASEVSPATNNMPPLQQSSLSISERRAKRASEDALQKLLRDAQSKFDRLNQENQLVANENRHLQEKLVEAEQLATESKTPLGNNSTEENQGEINEPLQQVAAVQQLVVREDSMEDTTNDFAVDASVEEDHQLEGVQDKDKELLVTDPQYQHDEDEHTIIKEELHKARDTFPTLFQEYCRMETDLEQTFEQNRQWGRQIVHLEGEIDDIRYTLHETQQSELMLKKSLKEALRLLQPLQSHLETAEREKKELSKQVKSLKSKLKKQNRDVLAQSVASQDTEPVAIPQEVYASF